MERDQPLSEVVGRVVDDAKAVARAEVDVVKAQALAKVRGYRTPAILFATAAAFVLSAVIGLVVGLILTVSTVIGPGYATLAVVGVFLLIAFLCIRIAAAKL